jgi:hypothetical protein
VRWPYRSAMSIAINRLTWMGATLMLFAAHGRLTPRQLSDIGTVEVPSSLKRDAKARRSMWRAGTLITPGTPERN